ncbi:MAG TPA: hypothetical protein VFV34_10310 [Blastocatellia bacterium]|nr:hypothetical protein [Blastocatellia bacterium]
MNDASNDITERAFKLAYFIHGDVPLSMSIAAGALSKLEVTASAQDKRLYYNPAGRSRSPALRTKVFLNEMHLLQRLVYLESESHERRQEADPSSGLREEDMVVRFIKHLVRITLKRNSFYVALGLNRLLHTYTTAEAMNIYNLVVQDPDRVRDDYYYRSRKKQLMSEMQERFNGLIRSLRGHRGEERFEPGDHQSKLSELVKKCLDVFTPWNTSCVLPAKIDPFSDELRPLAFKSGDPDQEHPIELNRIHSLTHPSCYAQLTGALQCDPPDQKLSVPRFFIEKDEQGGGQPRNRFENRPLSEEEAASIASVLSQAADRRRRASANVLSVTVDGTERARLDTGSHRSVRIEIEEGAELIEVHARDKAGLVPLAAHLLEHDESAANLAQTSSITLEGGQKVSFTIRLNKNSAGQLDGAIVDVHYRETSPARAAIYALRGAANRVKQAMDNPRARILAPAGLLALLIVGIGLVLLLSRPSSNTGDIVGDGATSNPQQPTNGNQPGPPPERNTANDNRPLVAKDVNSGGHRSKPLSEMIRSGVTPLSATSLVAVKQVHVDSLGDEPVAAEFGKRLVAALQDSKVKHVTDRDSADAVFKGSVRTGKTQPQGDILVDLQLVNQKGDVIWSAKTKRVARQYDPATVASALVERLTADIEKLQRAAGNRN